MFDRAATVESGTLSLSRDGHLLYAMTVPGGFGAEPPVDLGALVWAWLTQGRDVDLASVKAWREPARVPPPQP